MIELAKTGGCTKEASHICREKRGAAVAGFHEACESQKKREKRPLLRRGRKLWEVGGNTEPEGDRKALEKKRRGEQLKGGEKMWEGGINAELLYQF